MYPRRYDKVMKKKQGYFSISAVSSMLGIHQQTIRVYEREGFITPKRSDGNTRMFSEEDIETLEKIIHYTTHLGVNLAGVEIILKMQKKIDRMQEQVNTIFFESQKELVFNKDVFEKKASDAHEALQLMKKQKKHVHKNDQYFSHDVIAEIAKKKYENENDHNNSKQYMHNNNEKKR